MLVLTRKNQQQIHIGDNITITILQVKGQAVRVGIEAPRDVRVLRAELPVEEMLAADDSTTKLNLSAAPKAKASLPTATPALPRMSAPLANRILHGRMSVEGAADHRIVARRAPDVGSAPLIRYPQRLGTAANDRQSLPLNSHS